MQASPNRLLRWAATAALVAGAATHGAANLALPKYTTPMVKGQNGWSVVGEPVLTIGEAIGAYQPIGIPDGLGAYAKDRDTVRVFVNHEVTGSQGAPYTLANGLSLTGARISYIDLSRQTRVVEGAGLAYGRVYDRQGTLVTSAAQIHTDTGGSGNHGFARFCSAALFERGDYGLVDTIFFTNEEEDTGRGGSVWALDAARGDLWAVPAFGRGAWENVTLIDAGQPGKVAFLLGDDTASAPLYLYVGRKNAANDGSFLDRNGLKVGDLYAWRADNGDLTPQQFNGFGSVRGGAFVPVPAQDVTKAGMPGHDAFGWKDDVTLQAEADAKGCFSFSRPEDLSTNPRNGRQVAFASTGRGSLFPADNWGDVYTVDVDVRKLRATLEILHDADDLPVPDAGIRSPDNLVWAEDGLIYVQEDKSTAPGSLFGQATGIEASIWSLSPKSGVFTRIAVVDRTAVPPGMTDPVPGDIGNWETSGVIDVTRLFRRNGREDRDDCDDDDDRRPRGRDRLLLVTVQAHSVTDGAIAACNLVQGGQVIFLGNASGKGKKKDD